MASSAPFLAFGDAIERATVMALYGMPKLHILGSSTMGELCFNTEFPSIGLICSAHNEEIDNVLRRLIDSHLQDPETEVLVLHTDNSAIRDITCSLATPESRIYVSPRKPDKALQLYDAVGQEAYPLSFDCSEIALKHVLAFFSPRGEGSSDQEMLYHIQHVVSQLDESFDLQHLNELVGKEDWSRGGESFIALRQTVLTMLVSSNGMFSSPSHAQGETIVDLTDAILSDTGLDCVLMDMALKRFLETGAPQKTVVFNNSSDFLGSKSVISKSLESLAALGSRRPASIIIATTEPQLLPLKVLNALDYVVSGSSRSSVSRTFLEKHFMKSAVLRDKSHDGHVMIWSPNSLEFGNEVGSEDEGFGKSWDRTVVYVKFEAFNRTALSSASEDHLGDGYEYSISTMAGEDYQAAEGSTPHSSLQGSQEDGMMHLAEYLRTDAMFDSGIPSTGEKFRTRERTNSTQSKVVIEREISNIQVPDVKSSKGNDHPVQNALFSPSFAGGSSSNGDGVTADNSGKYPDLIKALLKAGNGQVGVWVDFEAARKLVGSNTVVKALGFPSYTGMVKEAHNHNIIERRRNRNDSHSIRLPPSSSTLSGQLDPKKKSKVAQSSKPPGTLNINDLSQMMKSKSTPPPGITPDSIRELTSNSRAPPKGSPGTQTSAGPSRTPVIDPPSTRTQAPLLVSDYPEAHRPVVTAMQTLNGGNVRTEVALGPLHKELRRMGFTNANQSASHMVSLATKARVIRCFNAKERMMFAVLESPELSRGSNS